MIERLIIPLIVGGVAAYLILTLFAGLSGALP